MIFIILTILKQIQLNYESFAAHPTNNISIQIFQ
jgi:hypothetical protein